MPLWISRRTVINRTGPYCGQGNGRRGFLQLQGQFLGATGRQLTDAGPAQLRLPSGFKLTNLLR